MVAGFIDLVAPKFFDNGALTRFLIIVAFLIKIVAKGRFCGRKRNDQTDLSGWICRRIYGKAKKFGKAFCEICLGAEPNGICNFSHISGALFYKICGPLKTEIPDKFSCRLIGDRF